MKNTAGQRIYAIGDVHGCLDELNAVLAGITADLAARPHPDPHILFLGDYVDRGPDCRGVIDRLIALSQGDIRTSFLIGNHDDRFIIYLQDPEARLRAGSEMHWFHPNIGGVQTLASYGIKDADAHAPSACFDAFCKVVPQSHRDFLNALQYTIRIGSYFFVHAGVFPGVSLDAQDPDDLIWIREEFLNSRADHGAIIVHGHTPARNAENWGNRIGVDTGAVFGGRLSCVILEGDDQAELRAGAPIPLPVKGRRP